MRRCFVLTTLMMLLSISYFTPPASGFVTPTEELGNIPCVDDGNNLHIYATELEEFSIKYDAVCDDDLYDWYHFPGWGDVNFDGSFSVRTDGPGLNIRLYFDNGGGIMDILQTTVEYNENNGAYSFVTSIEQACLDAGFPPPLTGDFWVRISVLGGYSGIHPYRMSFVLTPLPSLPGGANSMLNAAELPIGENLYGTLTQTDFYDWFYWEQPAGEPGDGIIELSMVHRCGSEEIPRTKIVVFYSTGAEVAYATLGGSEWFAYVDLAPFNLGPGTYYIDVLLEEAVTEPVSYQLRNRATFGTGGGCGPDANEGPSTAVTVTAEVPVSDTLCHPRDPADFYRFYNDSYFIGDIIFRPLVMDNLLGRRIWKGPSKVRASAGTLQSETFYNDPIPPGAFDVEVMDLFSRPDARSYELTVFPNGTGTYQAPGHGSWQTAHDVFEDYPSSYPYIFELEPGQQDRYCFKASTGTELYLLGWMKIYGSQPDYEVKVGKIGANGPVWGQTFFPGADGLITLDFSYQVLTEPGDHILRILLDPAVTERRRFYVERDVYEGQCFQEIPDDFYNSVAQPQHAGEDGLYYIGALCPGTDDVDYKRFTVGPDLAHYNEVPSDYRMVVKAGYQYMGFKLYDSSQNLIWAQQIAELGGTASVSLDGLVQDGEEYILLVNVESTEERLMMWRVDFLPPFPGIRPEVITDILLQRHGGLKLGF